MAKRGSGGPKRKPGGPKKTFSPALIAAFARTCWSTSALAQAFGVDTRTMEDRLAEDPACATAWNLAIQTRRNALRAASWETALGTERFNALVGPQLDAAKELNPAGAIPKKTFDRNGEEHDYSEKPNFTMQIWLGKNELGMSDKGFFGENGIDPSKLEDSNLEAMCIEILRRRGQKVRDAVTPADRREESAPLEGANDGEEDDDEEESREDFDS